MVPEKEFGNVFCPMAVNPMHIGHVAFLDAISNVSSEITVAIGRRKKKNRLSYQIRCKAFDQWNELAEMSGIIRLDYSGRLMDLDYTSFDAVGMGTDLLRVRDVCVPQWDSYLQAENAVIVHRPGINVSDSLVSTLESDFQKVCFV